MPLFSNLTYSLFLLFISGQLNAQITSEANSPELQTFLDHELAELFTSVKAVGASIAFVENGKVTYAGGFGFADRENGVSATPATVYRTGSMTKAMTAVAIMQLQQAGQLNINDLLEKHLPELHLTDRSGRKQLVSIRDVLTHLSGLPSDRLNGMMAMDQVADDGWQVNYLNEQPLSTTVNFSQAYSNVGYGLLGHLIACVSGKRYTDFMRDGLFRPLGMTTANVGDPTGALASGYVKDKPVQLDHSGDQAAAAVTASVLDMAEFLKLMLRQQPEGEAILTQASLRLMEHDYLPESFLPTAYGYGLGIDVRRCTLDSTADKHSVTLHKHSGNEIAFHGEFGYIPEMGVGVVVMTNTDRGFLACSTKDLLDLYLKHRQNTTFSIDYSIADHGLSVPTEAEVIGSYNIGPAGLEVSSANKFKFRMKGVKAVLRRRPGTMTYRVGLRLLGIIPVKVKDVVFQFVKKEDRVFLRQVDLARNAPEYLGERIDQPAITPAWRRMLGAYELTNPILTHNDKYNFAKANVRLVARDGWPVLSFKTPGMKYELCLTVLSDELAVTGGMGRHAGDPVRLLPDGTLLFSGFQLRKVD